MPIFARSKRVLAESDPNAELAPAAKRMSKKGDNGKENCSPAINSKPAIVEDQARKKGKGKSKEKDAPIANASEDKDNGLENIPASTAEKTVEVPKLAALKQSASNPNRDQKGKVSRVANGKKWICLCVPPDMAFDEEEDLDEDSDAHEDEDEDGQAHRHSKNRAIQPRCDGGVECPCGKPAEDYPDHKWIVTQKGYDLYLKWLEQAHNRCQDNFDMYIFNDFNGYGVCEVVENMLLAFDKEGKKKRFDSMAMWSLVESMALFLRGERRFHWHMLSSSESSAKLIMLIGSALVTALVFIKKKIIVNDKATNIRNMGLILSLFLRFADDFHDKCSRNEDGWATMVVQIADICQCSIESVDGMESILEKIERRAEADDSDDESVCSELSEEAKLEAQEKMWACYEDAPEMEGGTVTLESLARARGEVRDWNKGLNWEVELDAYCANLDGKVWGNRPFYEDDEMGGRCYDLTARDNKGWHMERYKLDNQSGL